MKQLSIHIASEGSPNAVQDDNDLTWWPPHSHSSSTWQF